MNKGRVAAVTGAGGGPSFEDPAGWDAPAVGAIVDELLARARSNAGHDGCSVRKG